MLKCHGSVNQTTIKERPTVPLRHLSAILSSHLYGAGGKCSRIHPRQRSSVPSQLLGNDPASRLGNRAKALGSQFSQQCRFPTAGAAGEDHVTRWAIHRHQCLLIEVLHGWWMTAPGANGQSDFLPGTCPPGISAIRGCSGSISVGRIDMSAISARWYYSFDLKMACSKRFLLEALAKPQIDVAGARRIGIDTRPACPILAGQVGGLASPFVRTTILDLARRRPIPVVRRLAFFRGQGRRLRPACFDALKGACRGIIPSTTRTSRYRRPLHQASRPQSARNARRGMPRLPGWEVRRAPSILTAHVSEPGFA